MQFNAKDGRDGVDSAITTEVRATASRSVPSYARSTKASIAKCKTETGTNTATTHNSSLKVPARKKSIHASSSTPIPQYAKSTEAWNAKTHKSGDHKPSKLSTHTEDSEHVSV